MAIPITALSVAELLRCQAAISLELSIRLETRGDVALSAAHLQAADMALQAAEHEEARGGAA